MFNDDYCTDSGKWKWGKETVHKSHSELLALPEILSVGSMYQNYFLLLPS